MVNLLLLRSFFCSQQRFQTHHLLSLQYPTLVVQSDLKAHIVANGGFHAENTIVSIMPV